MKKQRFYHHKKEIRGIILLIVLAGLILLVRFAPRQPVFEITDVLGGNIFPSAVLSVSTTDAQVVEPVAPYVGNPKSTISLKIKSGMAYSRVRVEVMGTPYFTHSASEFILEKARTEYTVYPDIIWRYDALRDNTQPMPISVVVKAEMNNDDLGQRVRTFSVRSINESLLGYVTDDKDYHDTGLFFAAYVNEENPMIDGILREALDTKIVNRFPGYQSLDKVSVDEQVYALWNVLQKRNFRYSSVSNTSLSSNIIYSQRVRTFSDALESSQINCVDGSVLMASLLRAINIEPVLIRIPGHMFIGYYTDKTKKEIHFLETTMIGDADLDEYFPEEHLGTKVAGQSQRQLSKLTFEKSKEYAQRLYEENKEGIHSGRVNFMFLEISKDIRKDIQPIGR